MAYADYYDGQAESTEAVLKKMQMYVSLALDNGDAVYQSKPGELTITIRLPKKAKDE